MAPLLLLALIPSAPTDTQRTRPVDFLGGLAVAMLIAILALGSLLVMYTQGTEYIIALLQTLIVIGLFLLLIIWLLSPHLGFSGLNQVWTRYVLNIGTPFEEWLKGVALSAELHSHPGPFLDDAMEQLAGLDWVNGVRWRTGDEEHTAGDASGYPTLIHTHDIEVTVFTGAPPGVALLLHSKLLIQLVGFFHWAKVAQSELAKQTHLKAIYETGARITHDIKNLLQSLHALTLVVQERGRVPSAEVDQLLRKQLPTLSQRLQLALDKLQAPESVGVTRHESAQSWWQHLVRRHETEDIRFLHSIDDDRTIPLECFDNVAENLLENARLKRQVEYGLQIEARLDIRDGQVRLSVQDSGSALPEVLARSLFTAPVSSDNGLGIGLYQAARLATKSGYALRLDCNRPGEVRFLLSLDANGSAKPSR